jgi:predicted nucleotidyltransferase
VNEVLHFSDFLKSKGISLNEREISPFYHDVLNPVFWTKKKDRSGDEKWVFDQRVRRKLLRIAKEFFSKFSDVLKEKNIVDIQLTGSLSNFNYTDFSDLDVHIIVDLKGIDDDNPQILKLAIDGIRFAWNLRHDIVIRGYDVELYVQNEDEPHTASALFSLLNNEWIKKPVYDPPTVDEMDVEKKYAGIVSDIENLHTRLMVSVDLPSNARQLYKRCVKLKDKIQKMRKEGLAKGGEMSIGNLAFKKLRNEGYIEKLIDIISKSYDKIYTEK